ncbi:type II toxin-antitoxin system PrlF family antitoxin [Thermosynechococcaceae cyanobacterium BACA0444]|uniref:Type II toxin-antitoxin system PrlF family antitoxin n=1 Tax=Pseudocalidococcus azoricus BACA0444 TaxID=2918990 RepID=A0AAE4FSH5_9CYAN|nr:type II toxin-antitoxin system PrlF family antitoxin [Pseudocalidococcus azoricus]MDS3860507.1 type II toxin-antitoxin system PrlF family antitoxin [Pseudocalidococcus azoricus BACA0444]
MTLLESSDSNQGDTSSIEAFLNFLAKDIDQHPEHIREVNSDLVAYVRVLVKDVTVELDLPLSDEDE